MASPSSPPPHTLTPSPTLSPHLQATPPKKLSSLEQTFSQPQSSPVQSHGRLQVDHVTAALRWPYRNSRREKTTMSNVIFAQQTSVKLLHRPRQRPTKCLAATDSSTTGPRPTAGTQAPSFICLEKVESGCGKLRHMSRNYLA